MHMGLHGYVSACLCQVPMHGESQSCPLIFL